MSDSTTIARPYAKAIFEYALGEKKLTEWSVYLTTLTHAILHPDGEQFIENPSTTVAQHIELLQDLIKVKAPKKDEAINNLISLLATNKRLMLLPEICVLYELLRAEQEKTLDVDLSSFSEVSQAQQERLVESLSKRLQRQVSLKINIDPSLLGGAVIRAGDLVIDGSIRDKLKRLSTELAT
jgi:F-type H+-transporting ATPase subunit delta